MRKLGEHDVAEFRTRPSGLTVVRHPLTSPVLAHAWQDFGARGYPTSPFETWEWIGGLARVDGNPFALLALCDGRPVGALALELAPGPRGLRRLVLAGSTWLAPDHCDVVGPPIWRLQAAQAIVRALLKQPGWDLLDFSGLRSGGALDRSIEQLRSFRLRPLAVEQVVCPYVTLAGRPATEAQFSKNLRSQVRRGLRSVESEGGLFEVIEEPAAVQVALDRLMDLHNARFGTRSAVFADDQRRRFHREVLPKLAAAGRARIYRLGSADGQSDAALLYGLRFGNRAFYYSMGLGDAAGSPGLTVLGQSILSAADEGASEFDLLRGDHDFKLRFATASRMDVRRRVLRISRGTAMRGTRDFIRSSLTSTGAV